MSLGVAQQGGVFREELPVQAKAAGQERVCVSGQVQRRNTAAVAKLGDLLRRHSADQHHEVEKLLATIENSLVIVVL